MRTTQIALGLLTACLLPGSAVNAQHRHKAPKKTTLQNSAVKPVTVMPPLAGA